MQQGVRSILESQDHVFRTCGNLQRVTCGPRMRNRVAETAGFQEVVKIVKEFRKSEILEWGQILSNYNGAYGSGRPVTNPIENGLGLDGHIWAFLPITTEQALGIWNNNSMEKSHPDSAYHQIGTAEKLYTSIYAHKIKKSLFAKSFYANVFNLTIDEGRVTFGWFSTLSFMATFEIYDTWLESGYSELEDSFEALVGSMGMD